MHTQSQFAELKYSKKIWAVGSIHSHFDSFNSVKEHILKHFVCGDILVFLGNIIGFGKYPRLVGHGYPRVKMQKPNEVR